MPHDIRQPPDLRRLSRSGWAGIHLQSRAFDQHGLIPPCYRRDGGNDSPDLRWSGLPSGTCELLLLVEDPDDPRRTVLHWLVTGIDPACTGVAAGETPKNGRVWCNDFGDLGYGGPQQPADNASHRYLFWLFALASPARLPRHPNAADVHRAIRDTVVASGVLVGRYPRQRRARPKLIDPIRHATRRRVDGGSGSSRAGFTVGLLR
jgi:Raf kinase inhibitor-like YbhB/YbcL family protein